MNAQPGPMVSGSHFFPKAPLLWVKWMPAWAVMSRKVMCCCACAKLATTSSNGKTHHRDIEAQSNADKKFFLKVCIYLWAQEVAVARAAAGLCPAGRPRAAVATWIVVAA